MEQKRVACSFRTAGFSACYGKFAAPDYSHSVNHEFCGGHYDSCAFSMFMRESQRCPEHSEKH